MTSKRKYERASVAIGIRPSRPMLTSFAAAAIAGIDRTTLNRRAAAGKMPGAQRTPGGHWRFPAEAVDAMVDSVLAHGVEVTGDPLTGETCDVIELGVRVERVRSASGGYGDAA